MTLQCDSAILLSDGQRSFSRRIKSTDNTLHDNTHKSRAHKLRHKLIYSIFTYKKSHTKLNDASADTIRISSDFSLK